MLHQVNCIFFNSDSIDSLCSHSQLKGKIKYAKYNKIFYVYFKLFWKTASLSKTKKPWSEQIFYALGM